MAKGKSLDVLKEALRACHTGWAALGFFSIFTNLLMLTGPLYMLQIYDRVLASGSMPTLAALTILVAGLFLAFGLLDFIRSRLLTRTAQRLDRHLGEVTFNSLVRRSVVSPGRATEQPLRDVGSLRAFISSQAPLTVFDLPWAPIYIAVIFLIHWYLGLVAIFGILTLFSLAVINEITTRRQLRRSGEEAILGNILVATIVRNAEAVEAMGMRAQLCRLWQKHNTLALISGTKGSDRAAGFSAGIKALRFFLQSLVLGVGAVLAVEQVITAGMMIAASIIVGRALAPIEQAVGQWQSFVSARSAYYRLKAHLSEAVPPEEGMSLPPAKGQLNVDHVFVYPPGQSKPILHDISFALEPGQSLGIIGPSAAGKSTLARVLVGIWSPSSGIVRLDGADISKWSRAEIGPQVGYLPQDVELFSGKVSENIARFSPELDANKVVEAAKLAGVHDMILHFPEGYDTEIGDAGRYLSAGQRQRLALARALYGNPTLVILDEPNSNLDAEGDTALQQAIEHLKENKKTVVVVAHRPSGIAAVDKILALEKGTIRAFGPKEEVLRKILKPVAPSVGAQPLRHA